MKLKDIGLVVGMALVSLYATGCGADCESICEDGKECPNANKSTDCAQTCEKAESDAEKAGCSDEYDDVVSCTGDLDDVCKQTESDCKSEWEAFGACVQKYCTSHPDDSVCQSSGG